MTLADDNVTKFFSGIIAILRANPKYPSHTDDGADVEKRKVPKTCIRISRGFAGLGSHKVPMQRLTAVSHVRSPPEGYG